MTPAAQLALGRIFRLLSRPERPGDVELYEAARRVALHEADAAGMGRFASDRPQIAPAGWNHGRIGAGCVE